MMLMQGSQYRRTQAINLAKMLLVGLFIILVITACSSGSRGPSTEQVTVRLESLANEDVYLILANPSPIKRSGFSVTSATTQALTSQANDSTSTDIANAEPIDPLYEEIQEFNRRAVFELQDASDELSVQTALTTNPNWTEGFQRPIYIDRAGSTVDTTLRLRRSKNVQGEDITLYIWVANHAWHQGGTKEHLLNQQQVIDLADTFLHPTQPAVYDWVTDIVGEPWGEHTRSNVIAPAEADHIHIVLKDIPRSTAGYFNAGNNFLDSNVDWRSNQGLYFFIDSTWAGRVDYPPIVASVLAHELQHVINFYQQGVLRDNASERWLDELASMAIEDLVADKLFVGWPRGIWPRGGIYDYGVGEQPVTGGGLVRYNPHTNYSLSDWQQTSVDYAKSYAFGAYLMRAYDGPRILRNIVQAPFKGQLAVTHAVKASGGPDSFAEILLDFGEAVLRSFDPAAPARVRMNHGSQGSAYSHAMFDYNYRLGSIDLHNVHWWEWSEEEEGYVLNRDRLGPMTMTLSAFDENYTFNETAKYLIAVARDFSGDYNLTFNIPEGMAYRMVRFAHRP